MTIVTTITGPIDIEITDVGAIASMVQWGTPSPTQFGLMVPGDFGMLFGGEGFSSFVNGRPTTGTITSIQQWGVTDHHTTWTGFSIAVTDFNAWIATNDVAAMQNAIFGGNDTATGSEFADNIFTYGGDDQITPVFGVSGDHVDAGAGNDAVRASGMSELDYYTGGAGGDSLVVLAGEETTIGQENQYAAWVSDFRMGTLDSFEAISFSQNTAPGPRIAAFTGDQATNAFTPTMQVSGGFGAAADIILIEGSGAIDISGWQFVGWTPIGLIFDQYGDLTFNNDAIVMTGSVGADDFTGSIQNDVLQGEGGDDILRGGLGNDLLDGWEGRDELYGGDGDDVLWISFGDAVSGEILDGGAGTDTLVVFDGDIDLRVCSLASIEQLSFYHDQPANGLVTARFTSAQVGSNLAAGLLVTGSDTADTVVVDASAGGPVDLSGWQFSSWAAEDVIEVGGSGQSDVITASAATDIIDAGAGNDTLISRAGANDNGTWNGGDGTDTLQLQSTGANNVWYLSANEVTFQSVEALTFVSNVGANSMLANFRSAQFGVGLSNNLAVTGSANSADRVNVYMTTASFNASGWTFSGWGSGDMLVVYGSSNSETISGSSQGDELTGSYGLDAVFGGDGDDRLIVNPSDLVSGETYDGGGGQDTLSLVGATNFDFRTLTVSSIEALTFSGGSGSASVNFNATQFGGGLSNNLAVTGVSASQDTIAVTMTAGGVFSAAGWTLSNWDANFDMLGLGGSSQNDTITGSSGRDVITGNSGDDTVNGGGGNDTLNGGLGVDTVSGGNGNDTFVYALGDGNGSMNGGADSDTLSITDGAADSILNASWNGAALTAVSGNGLTSIETITANLGGGADWLVYAAGSAAVTVNLATNSASGFYSIANIERVVGGGANDTLTGNGLDNRLDGGAGDDALAGGGGIDTLIGGDGADAISGGLSNDSIQAGAGNDTIAWAVGDGRDTIDGGADVDTFNATGSASAELGNATWNGSALTALMDNGLSNLEAVNLDLGGGVDWLIYNASAAVVVNLATNSASGFASIANIEKVIGGSGNDTLTGDTLDNRLDGLAGADTLDGGAGSDAVLGGDGDDVIYASAGNDSLQGQNGDDTFIWTSPDGRDTFNGGANTDTVNLTGAAVADVADTNWNGSTITGLLNNALVDIETVNLDLGDGGAGGDWLRYNSTVGISVDLGAGTATGFASIAGVENLIGGTGNDSLAGDGGVNKINGNNGDDVITGGAGNDNLTGGIGNDTFVYAAGAGNDTINDFDAWAVGGQDFLDVSAFGINAGNFAARVAIIDTGADTVIRIDDTYFITLKNVTGDGDNSITQADFIFGP